MIILKKRERPNWIVRVLIVFTLAVLIQIPPLLLLFVRHYSYSVVVVLGLLVIYAIVFGFIIWWARKLFISYRWIKPSHQGIISRISWIIGGWLAIIAGEQVLNILNTVIYHQRETANNVAIGKLMTGNHIVFVVMAIAAVILNPIAEELIFRGVVINFFFKEGSFWPPIILSGILFTLEHSSTTPISYLIYFYLAVVFAVVYRKTGNITNTICLHSLNNLIALGALLSTVH